MSILSQAVHALGSVADDVAQLDSYFDGIAGKPATTVASPANQNVPTPVAVTPTTLAASSSQTNMMIVAGVILLALVLAR